MGVAVYPEAFPKKEEVVRFFWNEEHMQDKVVVYGGDGTLLHVVHKLGLKHVYAPFNGGTLGFLMNPDNDESWQKFADGEYKIHEFNVLSIRARIRGTTDFLTKFAINDIYLERDSGQTARLYIEVDNEALMPDGVFLGADGVIVATSLGSTAYSFSAGGQISHPLVPLINLTPICPHLPKIPPMTLSVDSCVTIRPMETEKRPVRMVIDGKDYRQDFDVIEICRHHETLKIAYLDNMDFTQRLVKKIIKRS